MSIASQKNLALAKAAADAQGLRGKERHDFLRDYIAPTPSNVHKIARAKVHADATKGRWWQRMDEAYAKAHPILAFLGRFLRGLRKKRADAVGRWFRRERKRAAKEVVADIREGTSAELARIRRKSKKAAMKKRLREAAERLREIEIAALRESHAQLLNALMHTRGQWIHSVSAQECVDAVRAAGVKDFPGVPEDAPTL